MKYFLTFQFLLISLISLQAKYTIPNLSNSNWDTVLFLTPYGIISNFIKLQQGDNLLWSFYSDLSSGQVGLTITQQILMIFVYTLLFSNVYFLLRQVKK